MKIALVGSAPSSIRLAPYQDDSWTIWGCSPGAYPIVERVDAWFELHRWEPPVVGSPAKQVPWFTPEYCQWLAEMAGHDTPVYMSEVQAAVPSSVRYPREEMIKKYGPYFFTSSLAWMFALALEQPGVQEVGLWGVDMSATEEYAAQRPGCHYFITLAQQRGIKVTIPPESDLLRPQPMYGLSETSPMHVKLMARKREIEARLASCQATYENCVREQFFLKGALDDLNYILNTWVD